MMMSQEQLVVGNVAVAESETKCVSVGSLLPIPKTEQVGRTVREAEAALDVEEDGGSRVAAGLHVRLERRQIRDLVCLQWDRELSGSPVDC